MHVHTHAHTHSKEPLNYRYRHLEIPPTKWTVAILQWDSYMSKPHSCSQKGYFQASLLNVIWLLRKTRQLRSASTMKGRDRTEQNRIKWETKKVEKQSGVKINMWKKHHKYPKRNKRLHCIHNTRPWHHVQRNKYKGALGNSIMAASIKRSTDVQNIIRTTWFISFFQEVEEKLKRWKRSFICSIPIYKTCAA